MLKVVFYLTLALLFCSCRDQIRHESLIESRNRSDYVLLCRVEFSSGEARYTLIKTLYEAPSAIVPYKIGGLVYSYAIDSQSADMASEYSILFFATHLGEVVMDTELLVHDGKVYDGETAIPLDQALRRLDP